MKLLRCVFCNEEDCGDLRVIVDRRWKEESQYGEKGDNKFYRSGLLILCYNCDYGVKVYEVDENESIGCNKGNSRPKEG